MIKLRPGLPEEVGMSAQKIQYIRGLAKDWVTQGIVSALVVLVARRGSIVLQESFGQLAPDRNTSPELDTLFPFGSATTLITTTAAMILVDDGLLGLNRPVSTYIPEFRGEGKERVMVHHLLTHTSGFREKEVRAYIKKKKGSIKIPPPEAGQHPEINEYLFLTYDTPLESLPGSEMDYQHYGIELLGEIVHRVSGRLLPDFARERIFEPLGMKDTYYTVPDSARDRVVKRPPDAPFADWLDGRELQEIPWAAWGAFTTPGDMAIFCQMFLNRGRYGEVRILSPAAVTEMTCNQIPGVGAWFKDEFIPEASWGFGWNVHGHKRALGDGTLQSPQAFYQGNAGGLLMWVDPVYEIVGVYFSTALQLIVQEWPGDLFMNAVTAAVIDL